MNRSIKGLRHLYLHVIALFIAHHARSLIKICCTCLFNSIAIVMNSTNSQSTFVRKIYEIFVLYKYVIFDKCVLLQIYVIPCQRSSLYLRQVLFNVKLRTFDLRKISKESSEFLVEAWERERRAGASLATKLVLSMGYPLFPHRVTFLSVRGRGARRFFDSAPGVSQPGDGLQAACLFSAKRRGTRRSTSEDVERACTLV